MRYFLILLLIVVQYPAKAQDAEASPGDTSKAAIAIDIVRSLVSDKKGLQLVHLRTDFRTKRLLSDGMGYVPEMQDSAFSVNPAINGIVVAGLKGIRLNTTFAREYEIGRLSRRIMLDGLLLEATARSSNHNAVAYIEIGKPIDGWDIVDIIENNYMLKRYGKKTDVVLQDTLYIPVVYADMQNKNQYIIKHFLYSYKLSVQSGAVKSTLLNRQVLKIER